MEMEMANVGDAHFLQIYIYIYVQQRHMHNWKAGVIAFRVAIDARLATPQEK